MSSPPSFDGQDPSATTSSEAPIGPEAILRQTLGRPVEESIWTDIKALAEDMGGGWEQDEKGEGGRLGLPVTAGLRHGWVEGRLGIEARGAEADLVFSQQREVYRLHRPSVAILLFTAVAGLTLFAWPFFPLAASLLPFSLVLVIGAWFLVISRLTHRGVKEFLEIIAMETIEDNTARGTDEADQSWPKDSEGPAASFENSPEFSTDKPPKPLRPS